MTGILNKVQSQATGSLFLFALSGCATVGPDYVRPDLSATLNGTAKGVRIDDCLGTACQKG